VDRGTAFVAAASADAIPDPPNLQDSLLARDERRPVRLEELDTIE